MSIAGWEDHRCEFSDRLTLVVTETIPPHILVVDDDPQIRALLHDYFTANELRVSVTSSGKEMTRVLLDQAIDLVVLDLRLAGEDVFVAPGDLKVFRDEPTFVEDYVI